MKVQLWLKETSQPIEFDGVSNTYQKGSLYCIYIEGEDLVFKYPIDDIFRVIETYGPKATPKKEKELKS